MFIKTGIVNDHLKIEDLFDFLILKSGDRRTDTTLNIHYCGLAK